MGRYDKYGSDVRQIIAYAREEAQRLRHRWIGSEHLLLGLLRLHDMLIEGLFAALHVNTASIAQALEFVVGRGNKAILSEPTLNITARSTLARAEEIAYEELVEEIEVAHVFLAILEEHNSVALGVLESFGVHFEVARDQLSFLMHGGYERLVLSTHYYNRYEATVHLNQVSRDLTLAALSNLLDPLIGRERELERTMQILSRRTRNNPVLIGAAGVGKTALAEGLALRIVQGRVPEHLLNCRVVALDVGLLSIGTRFRGDLEERLKLIFQEVVANPGTIIFIDELQTVCQAGGVEGSLDVANLFKPMLARGEFQCLGATTMDEYRKTIAADPALERRFQPVVIEETTFQETVQILRGLRSHYEMYHHLTITEAALQAAVKFSSQYIQHRYQPDKAIDLLDEAAARVCVQSSLFPDMVQQLRTEVTTVVHEKDLAIARRQFPLAAQLLRRERFLHRRICQIEQDWQDTRAHQTPIVCPDDIAQVVAMWTGIPVTQISGDERAKLLHLEDELCRRVIGQHEAVQAIARAIRRSRANIRDGRRPIGSFVFVGPTGVGKTELARSLAALLFGDENALLKLDMSEFMESHHVSRLISSPPGYVGYERAGQLTEAVLRRPYSIILFDEVEKAHPHVLDLLLQILEDGCLTDARGQTVDFRHTVIILTSNVGTSHRSPERISLARLHPAESVQGAYELMRKRVLAGLKENFRPELLNRIDELIVFHSLESAHLLKILDLMVDQVRQRLLDQSITLCVTDAACHLLVSLGYTEEYGARPLRRVVQQFLEDPLAEALLSGTLAAGDTVLIEELDKEIHTTIQHPTTESPAAHISNTSHVAA